MENQFNVGDLVWAKVPHHPWWPSLIYHEALASTQAQQAKKEGFVLVSFFGDNSYKWLDPKKLLPFESNYDVYSNQGRSLLFVKAVNEAVYEVNHRAALGLTCPCQFFSSYRPAPVEGFLEVDVAGYKSGGVYTVRQIEQFRQEFRPVETLTSVRLLALDSTDMLQDMNHSKEVARILAFRKAKYAEVDEPYFLAFGVNPRRPGDPMVASNNQEMALSQAPTGHPSETESQGKNKSKIKCQNKNKRCPAPWKENLHATKAKSSVNRNRRHDSNCKISQDHVPRKKRSVKFDAERKLIFISASDNKRESSPSPIEKPLMSKDHEKVESSATTRECDDVHVVEKVQSSATFCVERILDPLLKEIELENVESSATTRKCDDVHFVEKVQSSATSVPSKTHRMHKDSKPTSKPLKKRQRSVSNMEGSKMPLTLSARKKRKEGESSTIVKPPRKGPRMILSMKFPPDTALPSASELKAKFARFGPIDTSRIRVSWVKSRCRVVFMNKFDAEKAYEHAVKLEKMFGQTKVTYKLRPEVSTSDLLEGGISGANVGRDLQQQETPATPPHAPFTSRSAFMCRIECLSQEIHAKYREQADQTRVKVVNQGSIDISEKMLSLLHECSRIVLEMKRL